MNQKNTFNISAERYRLRKSASEVAADIGVTTSALYAWESRRTRPSAEHLIALADYYGVTPDYLLDRTNGPHGTVAREQ